MSLHLEYKAGDKLLTLHDWGLQPLDQEAKLVLLQIMEDWYGKTSTIITSQIPISKWYEYLNDPTLANAILDHLIHGLTG